MNMKNLIILNPPINPNSDSSFKIYIPEKDEFPLFKVELIDEDSIFYGKYIDFYKKGIFDVVVKNLELSFNYVLKNIRTNSLDQITFTFEIKDANTLKKVINKLNEEDH